MLTVLIFILVISVLVFVHELGHFVLAKRAGMKVEEFGFGFPPRLFGIKKGETSYSINWIPFGGFVKIMGEDGSQRDDPRSFAAGTLGTRAGVIVAGVVMNLLFAILLLILGNGIGLRVGLDDKLTAQAGAKQIQIIQVDENSPAAQAGLKMFDEIVGYQAILEFQSFVTSHRGQEVLINIRRADRSLAVKLTPRANPPPGQGALGISLALTGIVKYSWPQAIKHGVQNAYYITRETAIGYGTVIKNVFAKGQPGAGLSGPIGIAVVTGQAARLGFTYLIQLVALISINLAILNIIPFPALDGGRLLFIIIEKLKGSPIPKRVEAAVNAVGFSLLIALMVYVTTQDISKFF